ncbi:MAG: hypothetical protein ACKO2Z_20395, partial [Sphaerospermopsis kisseleviana]
FDQAKSNIQVFRELIDTLNKQKQEVKLDDYTKKLDTLKQSIKDRLRFKVNDIQQLKERWLVEPVIGEEYSVGTLYTMFAHLVPLSSPYADMWLCPRTFSSMGIDSKVRKSKNIKDINCVKAKILKRRSMQRLYVFTTVIQKIPNYPTATGTL